MPLDGRNYVETKPAPVFSLEGLRDWLRTQPRETEYDFSDCGGGCLLGQYLASRGRRWSYSDYVRMAAIGGGPVADQIARYWPRTMAAALARCEAAIRKQEASSRVQIVARSG